MKSIIVIFSVMCLQLQWSFGTPISVSSFAYQDSSGNSITATSEDRSGKPNVVIGGTRRSTPLRPFPRLKPLRPFPRFHSLTRRLAPLRRFKRFIPPLEPLPPLPPLPSLPPLFPSILYSLSTFPRLFRPIFRPLSPFPRLFRPIFRPLSPFSQLYRFNFPPLLPIFPLFLPISTLLQSLFPLFPSLFSPIFPPVLRLRRMYSRYRPFRPIFPPRPRLRPFRPYDPLPMPQWKLLEPLSKPRSSDIGIDMFNSPNSAFAGAVAGPGFTHQIAAINPANPDNPNVNVIEHYADTPQGGNFVSMSSKSYSVSSNINGQEYSDRGAETVVNKNGKITAYSVKN